MANVEATREWWETRRSVFSLYISQTVLDEVARGTELNMKNPAFSKNRVSQLLP